ncbi:MAG: FAD-dependent oxidoreductase [Chloroflexota bacterium]
MNGGFSRLLSEATLGGLRLRNRIVVPPMVRNYADTEGVVTKRVIDHYRAPARGGAGMVIVEASYVHENGKGFYQQIGIHNDKCIPGLNYLSDSIKEWGAAAAIQLYHAGRQTSTSVTGQPVVAPSAIACPVSGGEPAALSEQEVSEMVEAFASAAKRAKTAGFDCIEVHAAHGYLISQFLSPHTNKRTDKYGGDAEKRFRFLREIVERTQQACGDDYPMIVRMNADDLVEEGIQLEDAQDYARKLQDMGVGALSITVGMYECLLNIRTTSPFGMGSMYGPHGELIELAHGIKKQVDLPVMAVGSITPEIAEEALEAGKADFIAIGRNLVVDPEYVNKLGRGERERIRPCIRCNEKCIGRLFDGFAMECTVNAETGFESDVLKPPLRRKKVLVAGGGPAGMEAARVAALRGHEVLLYEKSDQLGGHLKEATVAGFKDDLRAYKDWLVRELSHMGVQVMMGREVTQKVIETVKPDAVIVATGSEVARPPIQGSDKAATATDVFLGRVQPGTKNVIAGGGATGCELALHIARQGREAVVVELLPNVATDIPLINRGNLVAEMQDAGVSIVAESQIVEMKAGGVDVVGPDGTRSTVEGDRVILAIGFSSHRGLARDLEGMGIEVYVVGDSVQPRRVGEATREGYLAGAAV